MKVNELGEFGVIHLLTDVIKANRKGTDNASSLGFELIVDVGDDAAAWTSAGVTGLYTTDTVVDGVHFTRDTTPWYDLGWKLMAANVSDIAAMGGLSLYALVTLGLPVDTEVDDLRALYAGMVDLGNRYGVDIVGGDMVRSHVAFATVALTGATDSPLMIRSNASPGQLVAVTGYVGSSAGGLKVLTESRYEQGQAGSDPTPTDYLVSAHRRPEPCIDQGRTLSKHGITTAMDISDGLADDLAKLCAASGVSAAIEADKVPVHPFLKAVFPEKYMDLALGGGEDYQLIFIAEEGLMAEVIPTLPAPAVVIGRITAGEPGMVGVVDAGTGLHRSFPPGGWDHFKTNDEQ